MKEFIDLVKSHNVWLASVARVGISLAAAFGLQLTAEQMALLVSAIEVVFGVSQAKSNISEPNVDRIAEKKAMDIMSNPTEMRAAMDRRDEKAALTGQ